MHILIDYISPHSHLPVVVFPQNLMLLAGERLSLDTEVKVSDRLHMVALSLHPSIWVHPVVNYTVDRSTGQLVINLSLVANSETEVKKGDSLAYLFKGEPVMGNRITRSVGSVDMGTNILSVEG